MDHHKAHFLLLECSADTGSVPLSLYKSLGRAGPEKLRCARFGCPASCGLARGAAPLTSRTGWRGIDTLLADFSSRITRETLFGGLTWYSSGIGSQPVCTPLSVGCAFRR